MEAKKTTTVACPNCQQKVPWVANQQFKPFCCERCKLIDLGEWAAEEKRIPGEAAYLDSDINYDL